MIFDRSTSPTMDVTAGMMPGSLCQELAAAGVVLRSPDRRASVCDLVRAGGGEALIGELSRKVSLDGVVRSVLIEAPDASVSRPRR